MAIHSGYQPATGDSGGPTPGARALMTWYLDEYKTRANPAPADLGIYNPKRLGTGWSLHAEGRACDLGTRPYTQPSWGQELADRLRLNSHELGVQCIIYNRRIWSGSYPHAGWRTYTGSNPHTGHLHVELTRNAASTLTVERIRAILDGTPTTPKPPAPTPRPDWIQEVLMSLPTLKRGSKGAAVKRLQGLLLAHGGSAAGHVHSSGGIDGHFGPGTERAVREVQKVARPIDGIAGRITWTKLIKG